MLTVHFCSSRFVNQCEFILSSYTCFILWLKWSLLVHIHVFSVIQVMLYPKPRFGQKMALYAQEIWRSIRYLYLYVVRCLCNNFLLSAENNHCIGRPDWSEALSRLCKSLENVEIVSDSFTCCVLAFVCLSAGDAPESPSGVFGHMILQKRSALPHPLLTHLWILRRLRCTSL